MSEKYQLFDIIFQLLLNNFLDILQNIAIHSGVEICETDRAESGEDESR